MRTTAVRLVMTDEAADSQPLTIRVLYRDPSTGAVVIPRPALVPAFEVAA